MTTVPTLVVYLSEWGQFTIPQGLFERTKFRYVKASTYTGRKIVEEPAPISDNHEFFSWLNNEEIKAGKPA